MTPYEGSDVLENLSAAKNYNNALAGKVATYLRGTEVLDFGAGSGTFARIMRASGWKVSCVEKDSDYVKQLGADGFQVAESLDAFVDTYFSSVYSLNVLEHIDEDVTALRDIREKMVPDGQIVLFVPAHPVLYSSFDRRIGHFRRYTRSELESKVQQAGFVVTHWEYFDSLGYFVALLYRLLDRGQGRLPEGAVRFFDSVVFPISRLTDKFLKRILGKNIFLVAHPAK